MPQLTVSINEKPYVVACDPGQEQRIHDLAAYIDTKVANFAKQFPQAGEARLLVLAALMIADEFGDSVEALRRLRAQAAVTASGAGPTAVEDAALADGIDRLAARVEAVAARVETSYL